MTTDRKSEPQPRSSNIVVHNSNEKGDDYVIGDIHGCADELSFVLEHLKEGDRLFCAGDLFDRGPKNFEVFELLLKNKDKIFVTRGNHENLFLNYYDAFIAYEKNPSNTTKVAFEKNKKSIMSEHNGSRWMTELEKTQLNSEARSKFAVIAEHLHSLPYILYVSGSEKRKPFAVVHADLPFSTSILLNKIDEKDFTLNKEQKSHAAHARPGIDSNCFLYVEKTFPQFRVYCGHSIGGGVRFNRRHYNLDIGTFLNQCICLINHTQNNVWLIATDNTKKANADLPIHKSKTARDASVEIAHGLQFEIILSAATDYLNQVRETEGFTPYYDAIYNLISSIQETDFLTLSHWQKVLDQLRNVIILLNTKSNSPSEDKLNDTLMSKFLNAINKDNEFTREVVLDHGYKCMVYGNATSILRDAKDNLVDVDKLPDEVGKVKFLTDVLVKLPTENYPAFYPYYRNIKKFSEFKEIALTLLQLPDGIERVCRLLYYADENSFGGNFLTDTEQSVEDCLSILIQLHNAEDKTGFRFFLLHCKHDVLQNVFLELWKDKKYRPALHTFITTRNIGKFLNFCVEKENWHSAILILLQLGNDGTALKAESRHRIADNMPKLVEALLHLAEQMSSKEKQEVLDHICSEETVLGGFFNFDYKRDALEELKKLLSAKSTYETLLPRLEEGGTNKKEAVGTTHNTEQESKGAPPQNTILAMMREASRSVKPPPKRSP